MEPSIEHASKTPRSSTWSWIAVVGITTSIAAPAASAETSFARGWNHPWVGYGTDFGANGWGHSGLGSNGWSAQAFVNTQGFTNARRELQGQCTGGPALRVDVDLNPSSPNRRSGEVELSVINHPPLVGARRGPGQPLDLEGVTATVRLRVPSGSAGSPSAPNGIQLIFKTRLSDSDYRSLYTPWLNINPAWQGRCIDLEAPVSNTGPAAVRDAGFNARRVALVGVKLGLNSFARDPIVGFLDVESVRLPTAANPDLAFDFHESEIEQDFRVANRPGEVVRFFVFGDGRAAPEFAADGRVSGLDAEFFRDFDELLRAAASRNLRVMPVLLDFLWLGHERTVSGVRLRGHADIVRDPVKRASFFERALGPFLERYGSSPWIHSIDIINEPEWVMGGVAPTTPADLDPDFVTVAQMQAFVQQATAYIHEHTQLRVTLGSGRRMWLHLWTGAGLDFYQFHWYDHFENEEPLPWPPASGLGLDKPVIVGEVPSNSTKYSIEQFERAVCTGGYAGLLSWSFRAGDAFSLFPAEPAPSADVDLDGIPTAWEEQFGLNSRCASGDQGAAGDPDGDGLTNLQEYQGGSHPRGSFTRYFAEGATISIFDTRFALLNPSPDRASVLFTFMRADGSQVTHALEAAPHSRGTIDAKQVAAIAAGEFSTRIDSDVRLVADRTMTWDQSGYGAHAETSVAGPSTAWYLAEGATHSEFQLFYLIQNPNPSEATVRVEFLLPAPAPPVVRTYAIAPRSRFNVWVNTEAVLANTDVSASITSDVPVIVERAMYLNAGGKVFGAGHASAGITAPATEWFLAEGATGDFFDLFVLVANPSSHAAEIRATFLLPDGRTILKDYTVAASSRFNIWVDKEDAALADTAVSTIITSTNGVPVIVERAMWWPGPTAATWFEAHNSAGLTSTGRTWALAEGEVGGSRSVETYILIANRGAADTARVTLYYEDGTSESKDFPLAASSRANVAVAVDFPNAVGRRFGAVVQALGASPQIAVERAMYSNAPGVVWAAGTNAVATKLQ